tara:strand:+ start:930 stop:1982 length:1053 start_codon:yes stop_codon:yes gene_type:complete
LISSILEHNKTRLGVLICGHGSRHRLAVEEFALLAKNIKETLPGIPVEYGYLEFALPVITKALDRLRAQSVERVIAIPAMLFAAGHTKNDIPALLNKYSKSNSLVIDYGRELGINSLMIGAAGARVRQALEKSPSLAFSKTLLVVVGRGSSDPDANSNVTKITRMIVEGLGLGWGETVYSGVTFPLVEPGLRHLVRLGFRRIVVFPYFLFSGVLVDRIREQTAKVALDHPEIEFINADYLSSHPLVIETFKERIDEVLNGQNSMNCSLCKYRSNLLGFENEVGTVQISHHHHVEGINGNCPVCGSENLCVCKIDNDKLIPKDSGTCEIHSHTHPVYPNSDHPLGPRSLTS